VEDLNRSSAPSHWRDIQTALGALGFSPGPVDGLPGPRTFGAVATYLEAAQAGIASHGVLPGWVRAAILAQHEAIPAPAPADLIHGIDVSGWQPKIKWSMVGAAGNRFAWIKISEGVRYRSEHRIPQFKGARSIGLAVGGYHYGRPENDAEKEARHFLSALSLEPGDLPPVLDLEAGNKHNDEANAQWALTWLDRVESETGRIPMVYTASWYVSGWLRHASKELRARLADYPLWWARYRGLGTGGAPDQQSAQLISEHVRSRSEWAEWAVWQWTGKGSVPGVEGKCDRNVMRSDTLAGLTA